MTSNPYSLPPAGKPRLAVVVAWAGDAIGLEAFLGRVAEIEGSGELEILVVGPAHLAGAVRGGGALPKLRHIEASGNQPLSALRRAGMQAATGDIIILTDHREVDFDRRLVGLMHANGSGVR